MDRRRHDRRDRFDLVLRPEDRGRVAGAWRPPTWRWRLGALVIGVLIGLVALVAFQQIMPARILPDPPSGFEPVPPVVRHCVRASGTARRVRPGRRVRHRGERTPVRGGQPRVVEPPGRRPVRGRRRLAGRRGPRGLLAALGHEADPARPGPERRLAGDHHRRRARRHERVQRQAGVDRLARPARDDHAVRVPGRAAGRPRLRHPCGAGGLARRAHVHAARARLLRRHQRAGSA